MWQKSTWDLNKVDTNCLVPEKINKEQSTQTHRQHIGALRCRYTSRVLDCGSLTPASRGTLALHYAHATGWTLLITETAPTIHAPRREGFFLSIRIVCASILSLFSLHWIILTTLTVLILIHFGVVPFVWLLNLINNNNQCWFW